MSKPFVPSGRRRPRFERSALHASAFWVLSEIPDVNTDAMAAICMSCKARLSWAQWINSKDWEKRSMSCHRCERTLYRDEYCLDPSPELLEAVTVPGYGDRVWYHATRMKHWAREVREANGGNLIVHAGSKISALARADHLISEYPGDPVYLHSFRLRSSKRISTAVLDDMGEDWQEDLLDPLEMHMATAQGKIETHYRYRTLEKTGALGSLYYNRYEVPGDISILFHAPLIKLTTVTTVELKAPEAD